MLTLKDLCLESESLTLPNNARIIHFRKHGSPLAVQLTFVAGSRFDKITGTAHFLEHLLVAGTKKYPTKDKLAVAIESYGGFFKAITGIESLSIKFAIGNPENIKIISSLLEEMLFNSLFEDRIIEAERNAILCELSDKESNPIKKNAMAFQQLLFRDTPLENPTLGNPDSIKRISRTDLLSFYQSYILSGQAILVTSGDISFEKINDHFFSILSKIRHKQYLSVEPLKYPSTQDISIKKQKKISKIFFTYGFKTPPILHKDQPVLVILSQLLGGGRSSLLMRKLRYEKGLVYGLNSWNRSLSDCGSWTIQTSTNKNNFLEVLSIVKEQLISIKANGIKTDELSLVKNKIINFGLLGFQTSESIVRFHTFRQFFHLDSVWTIEDYTRGIENVTVEDVKRVVSNRFNKGYISILGNTDNIDKIRP